MIDSVLDSLVRSATKPVKTDARQMLTKYNFPAYIDHTFSKTHIWPPEVGRECTHSDTFSVIDRSSLFDLLIKSGLPYTLNLFEKSI